MEIVAVVGAGTLGGSLAHKLASRERFNQVRLIDTAGGIAAGKAADMQQAAAVERFHTEVTAHEHSDVTADADVIVLTGPAEIPDVEWPEEAGLHLLARVSAVNRGAVIVCAGASHRRLVGRGVANLRCRLIGSAPSAFHAALQAIVAVELRYSASEVALAVLGGYRRNTSSCRGARLRCAASASASCSTRARLTPSAVEGAAGVAARTLHVGLCDRSCL